WSQRRLNHQIVRLLDQLIERDRCGTVCSDVYSRHIWIMGNDAHAKSSCSGCDCLRDRSERQQAQHTPAQTIDWLARLPAPDSGASRSVIVADLAREREQQGHGMIRHLVLAPIVGNIGDQDVASRGRVNIYNIYPCAVASNDPAAS